MPSKANPTTGGRFERSKSGKLTKLATKEAAAPEAAASDIPTDSAASETAAAPTKKGKAE